MHCKEITSGAYERISAELDDVERQSGPIETVSGHHARHGWTVLLRDACRCMVLFDHLDEPDWAQADVPVEAFAFEPASSHS